MKMWKNTQRDIINIIKLKSNNKIAKELQENKHTNEKKKIVPTNFHFRHDLCGF
jgi:hypothetical protein